MGTKAAHRLLDRSNRLHYTATAFFPLDVDMPSNHLGQRVTFGAFTLDLTSGELRKHGTKLKLGEQPFQILSLLLERHGELVLREELHKRLWPSDTFVDFDHGLNSAMRRLRDVLGDEQEKPQWVETVPRRGYRFIGEVQLGTNGARAANRSAEPEEVQAEAETANGEAEKTQSKAWKWAATGVGIALALVVGAGFTWRAAGERRSAAELRTTVASSARRGKQIEPEARENYLKGRYAFLSGNGGASREHFEKAIALQPDYAEAYSGLADYYGGGSVGGELDPKMAIPEWEKNAKKALELDSTVPEPHHTMAAFYFFHQWNWTKAEEEEQRAIELNPNMSEAYHVLSYILFAENRMDDAVEAQRRATEVDPFARPWALGYVLMGAGRYAEAEAELRQELEVRPTNTDVRETLAAVLLAQGNEKLSAKELADSARRDGDPDSAAAIEKAFAEGGNTGLQQMRLQRLEMEAKKGYVSPIAMGMAYGRLRDKKKTLEWLEKAYEEHSPRLVRMWMESEWKWLHGDEDFRALAKRVGLVLPAD
jgi:DNA-binding winged helix-turn-helix (wHTH) protein/Tfp pilus assembly protein PilF